jgi:hypothetical protein
MTGLLTPTIAYVTRQGGPGRISIQPSTIAGMERALDAAIAQAVAAGGSRLAIEIFDAGRLVVRRGIAS